MSKLNPEAEAQKTVASFRDAAEKHTTIEKVWDEMAHNSKDFGHNSPQDKAYFHAVTEGLKKQGLLPELTVAYAQWHKNDMQNDDGDLGKYRVDEWSKLRKLDNGRVCEVEKAFIDNLKGQLDTMLKIGHRKVGDYDGKGLSDKDLAGVNAEYSKARHASEQSAAHAAQVQADARDLKHGLLDPRSDDKTVLFDKLAKANGGAFISSSSIEAAENFDKQQRELMYDSHKKGWHSYLDGHDKKTIIELSQYFNDIAPLVGGGRAGRHPADAISRDDLNRYLANHAADK